MVAGRALAGGLSGSADIMLLGEVFPEFISVNRLTVRANSEAGCLRCRAWSAATAAVAMNFDLVVVENVHQPGETAGLGGVQALIGGCRKGTGGGPGRSPGSRSGDDPTAQGSVEPDDPLARRRCRRSGDNTSMLPPFCPAAGNQTEVVEHFFRRGIGGMVVDLDLFQTAQR